MRPRSPSPPAIASERRWGDLQRRVRIPSLWKWLLVLRYYGTVASAWRRSPAPGWRGCAAKCQCSAIAGCCGQPPRTKPLGEVASRNSSLHHSQSAGEPGAVVVIRTAGPGAPNHDRAAPGPRPVLHWLWMGLRQEIRPGPRGRGCAPSASAGDDRQLRSAVQTRRSSGPRGS